MVVVAIIITLIPLECKAELSFIKAFNNPNEVTDIAEMSDNEVWTTSDCGLSKWDLSTGEVTTYNKRNSPLLRDYTGHVATKNEEVWVTSGERVFRIIGEEWTAFTWEDVGLPFEYNFDLVTVDSLGRVWVSFYFGAAFYENGSWTYFDQYNSSLYAYIESMEPGIDGDMWFGHTRLWVHNCSQYTSDGTWIPHNGFYYPEQIAVESDGQAWVRRGGLVAIVDSNDINIINGTDGIWGDYSQTYFGDIWSIKSGLGLRSSQHNIYHKDVGSKNIQRVWSFPDSLPWMIYLDRSISGNIYFKAYETFITDGFIKLRSSWSWSWFQTEGDLDNNEINGVFLSPLNHVYVGKWDHSYRYRSSGSDLIPIDDYMRYPRCVNDSLFAWISDGTIVFNNGAIIDPALNVWGFDIADDGTVYISDYYRPYYYKNGRTEEIKDCPVRPHYLAVDNNGRLWVADYNYDGFAIWDGYSWDHFEVNDPRVAQGNIDLLYVDSRNRMWCATNQSLPNYGLSMFDGEDWHIFDSSDGLPTPTIYRFTEDAIGNIWMATRLGLVKYDGDTFEIYNHTNTELPTPWVNAFEIDFTGNYWVGSDNGLFILNPTGNFIDALPENPVAENLLISIENGHPTLSWQCYTSLTGFQGFHIEKSRYGNRFTRVGTVSYSSSQTNYVFVDSTTYYGDQHYKIVEFDGIGRRWNGISGSISLDSSISTEFISAWRYTEEDTVTFQWQTDNSENIQFFALWGRQSDSTWRFLRKLPRDDDLNYTFKDTIGSFGAIAYKLEAVTHDFLRFSSNETDLVVREKPEVVLPNSYTMGFLYPNPVNNKISVNVEIPVSTNIKLRIFDILGRQVKQIDWPSVPAGWEVIDVPLNDLASGVYFLRLDEPFGLTQKFTLLK